MTMKKSLPSTRNTPATRLRIRQAWSVIFGGRIPESIYEHGHWWMHCGDATWDVVDAEGGRAALGFDFERVS